MDNIKQYLKNKNVIFGSGVVSIILGLVSLFLSNAIVSNTGNGFFVFISALFAIGSFLFIALGVVLFIIGAIVHLTKRGVEEVKALIPSTTPASPEQRKDILQREINKYVSRGFRVVSQTDSTAQLVKPKQFSCLMFIIFALLLIGWIFYLLWYWSKKDEQVYIEVDQFGNIKTRK